MKTFKIVMAGGAPSERVEWLTFDDDAHITIEDNGVTTIRGGNYNRILASIPPHNILTVSMVDTKRVVPKDDDSPA